MKFRPAAIAALIALMVSPVAAAEKLGPYGEDPLDRGVGFPMLHGGQSIFTGLCQGCHMSDAKGAVGAGAYPALARDSKLQVAGYPVAVVTHGQKAMPPLGDYLNDQQVADVVNYIRGNFGNTYKDKVKPEDVKAIR
jgi:mono/diheme cytochrome c family protein